MKRNMDVVLYVLLLSFIRNRFINGLVVVVVAWIVTVASLLTKKKNKNHNWNVKHVIELKKH